MVNPQLFLIVYNDFIMAKRFTQASKDTSSDFKLPCSLKRFPHLTFHLLPRPLRDWDEEQVGYNVVQNRNFEFFDVEKFCDYEEVLKAAVSSNYLDRNAAYMIKKMIEKDSEEDSKEHPEKLKCVNFAYYKTFHYKFDYTINSVYCKHQILHLIDSNVHDCHFGKECRHKHMDNFLLSTIIGYLTCNVNGNEYIFGCIHCFYNYEFEYNVLWLNVLDDFYDKFEENSFEYCVTTRFNDEVMPVLFPIMTVKELGEYDELILELCDCFGDESNYFDELLIVMFEQYQDEGED